MILSPSLDGREVLRLTQCQAGWGLSTREEGEAYLIAGVSGNPPL